MSPATDNSSLTLGQQVKQARDALGLSAEGLAFKAGVSIRTVTRLEADEVVPRRATLRVITDALGLELEASAA